MLSGHAWISSQLQAKNRVHLGLLRFLEQVGDIDSDNVCIFLQYRPITTLNPVSSDASKLGHNEFDIVTSFSVIQINQQKMDKAN